MNQISTSVAGVISIALIVTLGIFVYPRLLAMRYGVWAVALITPVLGILFVVFQGRASSTPALISGGAWALAPVVAALVVRRFQRKS